MKKKKKPKKNIFFIFKINFLIILLFSIKKKNFKNYTEGYESETPTVRPTPEAEYRTQITVSIAKPEITIIPVGGSIELSCTGHMAWNGVSIANKKEFNFGEKFKLKNFVFFIFVITRALFLLAGINSAIKCLLAMNKLMVF